MEHVQCGRKNRAAIKNGDVQSRSRRQSSNRKQVKQQSITHKTNASTYTKLFICATEKIDWNRSPKAISSEWFWSPPASPMKEKEEVEELKLPAVSPSNSNKADVKSLTKDMGSLGLNDDEKTDTVVAKEDLKTETQKTPAEKKPAEKKPAKTDNKKEEKKKTDTKSDKSKLRANAPEFKLRASAPSFTPGGFRPRPTMPATGAFAPRGYPVVDMRHHFRMPLNAQGKPMTPQEYQMLQQQQYAAMMAQQQRNARPYRPPPQ